jgi:homeobox-leucine zipper protein
MAQEDVHLSDAGLALGLSLGGASDAAHHNSPTTTRRAASPCPLVEPSLTLSMPPDEATGGGVKRERVEDDDGGSARKKLRLTKEQSALLEDRFKEHSTLNPVTKYCTVLVWLAAAQQWK